jgi:hypothetical protein
MKKSRIFAVAGACLLGLAGVSSTGLSASPSNIRFELSDDRGGKSQIHARFRYGEDGRNRNEWSDDLRPRELVGLELAGLRAGGTRPLRFALMREAGRLDCAGEGGGSRASGNCRFASNPAFIASLARLGVGQVPATKHFGMMALNVRASTVEEIVAARYPVPTIDQLISLTALGADAMYIREIAQAGYRLESIDKLIEFKALGVTGSWIRGFVQAGYTDLSAGKLVEMRALGITPAFAVGFGRIGYGLLPAGKLIELKALGATPEWAQEMARKHGRRPSADQLVQMKALGF